MQTPALLAPPQGVNLPVALHLFLRNINVAWVSSVIILVPLSIPDVFELKKIN